MLSALRSISQYTGGRAGVGEEIGAALARLDANTRSAYLLGYYPQNEKWDGRYRRIDVKVNRPGLKVLFRQGYYARDTLKPFDRQEFLAYSRISAAAAYESEIADIPFKAATAKAPKSEGQPQVKVVLRIDLGKVGFKILNDRHMGKLRISLFFADAEGRCLGDDWKTMDLRLREANYQRFLESGISYSTLIPLKVSNQLIKVVVYDPTSDRVGTRLIKTR